MVAASGFEWFWEGPSFGWSCAWALFFVLLVDVIAIVRSGAPFFVRVVNGDDGRWSTSKTTFAIWTYTVVWAFVTILIQSRDVPTELQPEYLLVLGFPASAAVIAKAITKSNVAAGKVTTKEPAAGDAAEGAETRNPVTGIGQVVTNDHGRIDLLDFQHFAFNLVLLAYFVARFLEEGAAGGRLPDLPDTLLGLTGVAAAAYVGKKGTEGDDVPAIRSVTPPQAAPGAQITLRGVNLATVANREVEVLVGPSQAADPKVTLGEGHSVILLTVPQDAPKGTTTVKVVRADGRSAEAVFTVT